MQPMYTPYVKPFSFSNNEVNINIFIYFHQDWVLSLKCLNLEVEDSSAQVLGPEVCSSLNSEGESLARLAWASVHISSLPAYLSCLKV